MTVGNKVENWKKDDVLVFLKDRDLIKRGTKVKLLEDPKIECGGIYLDFTFLETLNVILNFAHIDEDMLRNLTLQTRQAKNKLYLISTVSFL